MPAEHLIDKLCVHYMPKANQTPLSIEVGDNSERALQQLQGITDKVSFAVKYAAGEETTSSTDKFGLRQVYTNGTTLTMA